LFDQRLSKAAHDRHMAASTAMLRLRAPHDSLLPLFAESSLWLD